MLSLSLDPLLEDFKDIGAGAEELAKASLEAGLAADSGGTWGWLSDLWGGIKEILGDVWEAGGKQIAVDWLRREVLGDEIKLSLPPLPSAPTRTNLVLPTPEPKLPEFKTAPVQPQPTPTTPIVAPMPYPPPTSYEQKDFLDELFSNPMYLMMMGLGFMTILILLMNRR